MRSLSKCKKRSIKLNAIKSEDRITNLPSCLITKILSCLPTKDAVATSVLSTKWRRSWTSITKLDFYDRYQERDIRKFTSFVNRVLLLRDRTLLERICMLCLCDYDGTLVNAWLVAIQQCNVKELDISINTKNPGLLPSDLFLSNRVTVLKLDVVGYVDMPASVCLPALRTLHLRRVQLSDDVSIINLLSGCPVLEDLKLCECVGNGVRVVNITARALKWMTIKYLPCDGNKEYRIVIDTPALEYFNCQDYIPKVYVVNNMDHLITAKIDFELDGDVFDDTNQFGETYSTTIEDIEDFLNGISQVENLFLSWVSVRVISSCNYVLPRFGKLTYLKLYISDDPGCIFLAKLLENSPCLETLKLVQLKDRKDAGNLVGLPLHDVPSCFPCHLKTISIDLLNENEMGAVEYILKNAKVLEKLILHYNMPSTDTREDDSEFSKALLSLPKASTNCEVVLQRLVI